MRIPSIRLLNPPNNLIQELCIFLRNEHKALDKKEKENATFQFVRHTRKGAKKEEQEYTSPEAFANIYISKDVEQITMYLRTQSKSVWIDISMDSMILNESHFSVEGFDTDWVHGRTTELQTLFQKFSPNTDLYHDWRKALPIYASIVTAQTVVLYLWLLTTDQFFRAFYEIVIIGVSIMSIVGWYFLFRWLFPRVETEHMRRPKVRKAVLGLIGAIIVTILAEVIMQSSGGLLKLVFH
jgi:hypothetical protein